MSEHNGSSDSASPRREGGEDASPADSRLEIFQEIALALNSTLDPIRLLEVLLDSSIRYTGATTGSVILLEGETLRIVASRGLGQDVGDKVALRVGEGITGWVAKHGEALGVPDVRKEDRYIMVKEHIRSELAVPMILDKRVVGVISVDSTRKDNFSKQDLELLTIVGTQAAQILENAQSFSELRRRNIQDETLLEISQALGSSLVFEDLFTQVSEILARRCELSQCFLVLVQPDSDDLKISLAYGMTEEEMAKGQYARGEGIIGRVVESGEPIGVRDISQEPKFLGRTGAFRTGSEQMTFMAVPINLEGKVVGVLGGAKPFHGDKEFDQDMALLQIITGTLAQAVKIYQDAAAERERLLEENRMLKAELRERYNFDGIVGNSPAIQAIFQTIVSVAPARSTVLVRGESGTGKELIANAIHYNSPRSEGPFVRVNCAAIPEPLLEAELFGHVKGAFTGAIADRKGKFVLADGGTIFLDEIGDMSPMLQAKMLRVLQEKEVDTVGAETPLQVDVRVIAATHRDLEQLVQDGTFREDLYYRLNVVPIAMPPLRDHPEDIRLLAHHFLDKFSAENDLPPMKLGKDALRELMAYSWPGNVRELENLIERAVILCDGTKIHAADIPLLRNDANPGHLDAGEKTLDSSVSAHFHSLLGSSSSREIWSDTMEVVEKTLLSEALERCDGVRLRAADLLGIHRNTLRKKADDFGL
ncbi:MAG: sigma 54-interacting transcriptional regulator [Planctomycetota bacterium]